VASLIFFSYFYGALRWARWVQFLVVLFLAWRIVGNITMLITLETWIPLVFPNFGQSILLFYSMFDFFHWTEYIYDKAGWNILLVVLAVALKLWQEFSIWYNYDGLGPPECNSVQLCLGVWYMPALSFFVVAVWAGVVRLPDWLPNTVDSSDGIFRWLRHYKSEAMSA